MSKKIYGVLLFLLGIPIFLMAWVTLGEANGYYMSEVANDPFPLGIAFVVLVGTMGLTLSITGLAIIYRYRNI